MAWTETDLAHMRLALAEAEAADAQHEVPIGAVVTIDGDMIAAGHNRSVVDADPSGHAEIVVLRNACRTVANHRLSGATLYVTLEPCAMCIGAIAQARISRLVFGAYDPKAGAAGSAIDLVGSKALNHRFEVNGGVLADKCGALLKEFFQKRRGDL